MEGGKVPQEEGNALRGPCPKTGLGVVRANREKKPKPARGKNSSGATGLAEHWDA